MKNRVQVLLAGLLLLPVLTLFAQPGGQFEFGEGPRSERIEAARVAYITQRLGLTTGESSSFWALNNEYEADRKAVKEKYKPAVAPEQMTNDEASQHLENELKAETELLNLRKAYQVKFTEVLPARKLVLFSHADREFRLELLKKIRNDRRPGGRF